MSEEYIYLPYAVLPVGVETISPSPWTTVTCLPSINKSTLDKYGLGPRSTTTSLSTRKFMGELLDLLLDPFVRLVWIPIPFWETCPLLVICPVSAVASVDCRRFRVHFNLLLKVRAAFPSKTLVTFSSKLSKRNGVKKPNDPKWNAITGGTDCWNWIFH